MTDTNTSESALPPLVVNGQYVKDLSFEVPGAPAIFAEMQGQNPNIPIHVDINAQQLHENTYEVSLHLKVEMAGAVCWLAGTLAWMAGDLAAGIQGWVAFLVLTIAGERRELMQMIRLSALPRVLFAVGVALMLMAVALSPWQPIVAGALLWLACALLAAWLLLWVQAFAGEIGWRGYMLPRLMARYGPVRGLLLHGVAWGLTYGPTLFFAIVQRGGVVEDDTNVRDSHIAFRVVADRSSKASRGSRAVTSKRSSKAASPVASAGVAARESARSTRPGEARARGRSEVLGLGRLHHRTNRRARPRVQDI